MQIKIFDDFLTKSYHEEILKLMSSFNFPWYWQDNITLKEGSKNLNKYGFSHIFWTQEAGQRNSIETLFLKSALLQMLDVTECNSIVRSRADMTTYVGKEFIHDPHIDFDFPHIASIYYVNDSDGDTIFYNQKTYDTKQIDNLDLQEYKRVTPKANRLVIFEGNIVHTGSSPVNSKKRILINSNFLTTKKNVL